MTLCSAVLSPGPPISSPPGVFRRPHCFPPSTLWVSNECSRHLCSIRPRRQDEFGDRPPTDTMTYSLTITTAARSTSVRIAGDLDYQTTDDLVEVASQLLTLQSTMSDLHLDFSELTFLDSAALSGLLTLHGRTSRRGSATPRPSPAIPRPRPPGDGAVRSLRSDPQRCGDRRSQLAEPGKFG